MARMSRQRALKQLKHRVALLILLGFLNALHGVVCKGFSPNVTSSKLGTSKGGTRLNIHVTGSGIDDVRPHYLRVNDWDPVRATYQNVVSNGAIEDEFVMPPLSYTTRSVVRLSYSLDGVRYVKAGEFVYYDGEELETTALHPADIEGAWNLRSSIFPRSNTYELLSMSFIPTCRDEDGVITEARYPIPYEYARQPNAKLTIHCPVESPKRIKQISLNGQDYVDVKDPYDEHRRLVDYVALDLMANPPQSSLTLIPLTANQSLGSASNGSPPTPVATPPSAGPLPKAGRQLGSYMPVCTCTDTGMGLSILVMYPTPTTPGIINVTTDVAGSFTGVGGPITYLVSVLIGSPGSYKLTSIVPSCAGITLPLSFNVSGPPSPQFSYISTTFAPSGYAPGTPVSFNIQVVDGQGIVPTGFYGGGGGPFPFKVTLSQSTIVGSNATFPVSFTTTQQGNGAWQVTCTPTRFLPITGSVTLNGLPIVNSQFNFSLQSLSAGDAATKFSVFPNSSVPTGQQSLIIKTIGTPKYSLIHQISAQVIDPSGANVVMGMCDMGRTNPDCYFPMLLLKPGTYKLNVTIDSGTSISQVPQFVVMPGMALGNMSSLRLDGIASNTTQKTAGDIILANLNLQDAYGNAAATTFTYGGWNATVKVVLTCAEGSSLTMNVLPGLGSTNASAQVTQAGYYVASAFIGSTGNLLQGSGVYGFYVNPNSGNASCWKANIMVGEMIAGVNTPVVLALKDCFGNVIDGSSLRGAALLTVNMGVSNYSVQSVGRIFQVIPGLNQTVAKSGIIITANYGSVQLATYNATCLPGPLIACR